VSILARDIKITLIKGVLMWEIFTTNIPYQGVPIDTLVIRLSSEGSFLGRLPITSPVEIRKLFEQTQDLSPKMRPKLSYMITILEHALNQEKKVVINST
jgi:hypothetical protein